MISNSSNNSNNSIRIRAISKIAFIVAISFIGLDAQGANNQENFDGFNTQESKAEVFDANVESCDSNNGHIIHNRNILKLNDDFWKLNNDTLSHDSSSAEENLEDRKSVFNNGLSSVLNSGQKALCFMLNSGQKALCFVLNNGYNCLSFVAKKIVNFSASIIDTLFPYDGIYGDTSFWSSFTGYRPLQSLLMGSIMLDLLESNDGTRTACVFLCTAHYYYDRWYRSTHKKD